MIRLKTLRTLYVVRTLSLFVGGAAPMSATAAPEATPPRSVEERSDGRFISGDSHVFMAAAR